MLWACSHALPMKMRPNHVLIDFESLQPHGLDLLLASPHVRFTDDVVTDGTFASLDALLHSMQ